MIQTPLHHLVTDLYQPNQTSLEVLAKNIASTKLKGIALGVLEKICYVALVALVSFVFATSYNLIALTEMTTALVAGLILSSPILVIAAVKLAVFSRQYSLLAEIESRVALKLRSIQDYDLTQIRNFCETHQLNVDQIPWSALRQIRPTNPEKLLLPMIARFEALRDSAIHIQSVYSQEIENLERSFLAQEQGGRVPIPNARKQTFRYNLQEALWKTLEEEAIPYALNAAVLLRLIQNPTIRGIDADPLSLNIPGVGYCTPRSYAERMFGKTKQAYNDDYFVFHQNQNREALTHKTLQEKHLDPANLRDLLFHP